MPRFYNLISFSIFFTFFSLLLLSLFLLFLLLLPLLLLSLFLLFLLLLFLLLLSFPSSLRSLQYPYKIAFSGSEDSQELKTCRTIYHVIKPGVLIAPFA